MRRLGGAALLVVALLAIACGDDSPPVTPRPTSTPTLTAPGPGAGGQSVTDMAGRSVRVPERAESVVALSPGTAELALALGLDVAGRPTDAANIAGIEDAAPVGSTLFPDFNAAAALEPDLLIADATFHGGRDRDFARFPYPVFVISILSLDDVGAALEALGEATGRTEEAAEAVADIEDAIDEVVASVADQPPVRVLILSGTGRDIYAASNDTYIGSMVTVLGAKNVLGDEPQGAPLPGFGLAEPAHLAQHDPDVVLLLSTEEGGLRAELQSLPEWQDRQALLNDRLVELDTGDYLRNAGPRAPEALAALAEVLYP